MSTTDQLLVQLLANVGALREEMGEVRARLDHGQGKFEGIERTLRDVIDPLVTKVQSWEAKVKGWEAHVTTSRAMIIEFEQMKPEFTKMKVVTSRFMAVALASGAIVGAALWLLGTIWPFVVGFLKLWIGQHIGWR